ncbi:AAA family ATPase [Chloroflexota bacterium]
MIPVTLSMRNFMCYRENVPPLHFDGLHLVCLSGDNGNGKSALVDAMTWALWGEARAKSDDDLISAGLTDMEVEFEFAVERQIFRIIRKRSQPKRQKGSGMPTLELQRAADNGFSSITGNSIAQTQQKIIDILHMDYQTFVNSAYLRQGHADEFTTQRPADRKGVLANILGLSDYDELAEQAREKARQQENDKTQLENTLQEIAGELAQKPVYEAELGEAENKLSGIEQVTAEQEARLEKLRGQKETLEKKQVALEQLQVHIRDTSGNLESWEEQIKQHQSRISEYEELLARRDAIEEGYARFAETRKLYEELDRKFRQSVTLDQQRSQLENKIKEASQSLNTNHALIQSKIDDLSEKTQNLPHLKNQRQQLQSRQQQLAEREELKRAKAKSAQELQTQVNYLESQNARLEQEIVEIREKLDLLSDKREASCPLCETELGIEGLNLIRSKYTDDEQSKNNLLSSNQAELARKKTEVESLQKEIAQLELQLNQERSSQQGEARLLEKEIADAEEAEKQLAEFRARLAEIEQRLASRDFAAIEQEALSAVEDELARLNYDSAQHERAQQQLKELEPFEQSHRKLEEAYKSINQEKEAAARAEEAVNKLKQSLEADRQKRQQLEEELKLLPDVLSDLAQAEAESQELKKQRNQAQETVWNVKAKLQHCVELETRKKEKGKLLSQAAREENIYKELTKAFGKTGIQALLIEMALPEIEEQANRLLSRMTDNRMHVKFETQRETKKGDVIETLDINISDELGSRNYEMFSGGEAFRIDFAIRIALSKLLAKRAGAPLPTLIIDEGFGTQDSTGIERLKGAINSIQDDFEKIIVITHIEELRDAFPARIDVVKTAEGSTLSVG